MSPTCVRVEQRAGAVTFARARCEVVAHDVLTVLWLDSGREAQTFTAGTWVDALLFDEQGQVVSAFVSTIGEQQARARIAAALALGRVS
jgi:hypothetical protein